MPPSQSRDALRPGERIAGYAIESVIARGGMGVVYRARQIQLERAVALKVIGGERAQDAVFRARFVREARLAASLDHPNVIPIFEAGEDRGRLFIAMRLVDGSDLERLIAERGPLDAGLAVRLIEQAAAGLDAAHARGLIHRDIKPANILLAGPPGEAHVYVSDFGVAKSLGPARSLTSSAEWVGTAGYAPAEQIQGGEVDRRADVYALGCVLFAALGGRPPFHEPPPGGVPAELAAVLERALARNPADRYPSAGGLARAARAALDHPARSGPEGGVAPTRPAAATVVTAATAPSRRVTRREHRRVLAGIAGALALGVSAALVAAVVFGAQPSAPPHRPAPAAALPARPAEAAGDSGTIVCQVATCTQAGRPVAAPIEGAPCERTGTGAAGAAATWTRIDHQASEPILLCVPAAPPPTGALTPPLPGLVGAQLDRAELALDRLRIGHDTSGGGLFGIFDRSGWIICATSPPAGTLLAGGQRVKLFVDRSC